MLIVLTQLIPVLHVWRWKLANQATEGLLTARIIQEVDVYLKIPLLEVASAARTEMFWLY